VTEHPLKGNQVSWPGLPEDPIFPPGFCLLLFAPFVMPAHAGIQMCRPRGGASLDSRVRGNDNGKDPELRFNPMPLSACSRPRAEDYA
jgi:hypothetical protein